MKIITDTKDKIILILSGLLLIAILIICLKSCQPKPVPQYWENKKFKTDTIQIPKPYPIKGDSFPYYVPPKVVLRYLPDTSNKNKVKDISDSLFEVIDSLGKELTLINRNFLTQFPYSPKLIGGLFTQDTFKLDLLTIDGLALSHIYPIDYPNFRYQWKDNELRAIPIVKPNLKKNIFSHSFYGNVGYEILSRKPFGSVDYYITYGKFKINIEPRFTIESKPTLEINSKLGFRIK